MEDNNLSVVFVQAINDVLPFLRQLQAVVDLDALLVCCYCRRLRTKDECHMRLLGPTDLVNQWRETTDHRWEISNLKARVTGWSEEVLSSRWWGMGDRFQR